MNAAATRQATNPDGRLVCLDPSQVDGGKSEVIVPLKGGKEVTVGRGDTSTFLVASRKLSRQHARLFSGEGSWGIEDLNSTNGVYVNGHKVSTIWLKHKDAVRLGSLAFSFELACTDTVVAGAELITETVRARARCTGCDTEWAVGMPPDLTCPRCTTGQVDLLSGRELHIIGAEWDAHPAYVQEG